jgi:hypothetical protein
VIAFLRLRPELLSAFNQDANAFPSARWWSLAVSPECLTETPRNDGAATEFSGFLRVYRDQPNIDAILLNPHRETVPESPAALYAIASALARCATEFNFDRVCAYLERMPTEFRMLCVRDASLREPESCESGSKPPVWTRPRCKVYPDGTGAKKRPAGHRKIARRVKHKDFIWLAANVRTAIMFALSHGHRSALAASGCLG